MTDKTLDMPKKNKHGILHPDNCAKAIQEVLSPAGENCVGRVMTSQQIVTEVQKRYAYSRITICVNLSKGKDCKWTIDASPNAWRYYYTPKFTLA